MTLFGLYFGWLQTIMLLVSISTAVSGTRQYLANPERNIKLLNLTTAAGDRVTKHTVGMVGLVICFICFSLIYAFTPFFNVFGPIQFLYCSLFALFMFNDLERGYVSTRPDIQIPKMIFFYFLLYLGGFFTPNV